MTAAARAVARTAAADVGELRYERKLVVAARSAHLEGVLFRLPAGLREQHAPRQVNSLYLDTPDLSLCRANLTGVGRRAKVRVRWYGDEDDGAPVQLEHKHRVGELVAKSVRPLPGRSPARALEADELAELAHLALSPSLLVRYRRRYLVDFSGRIRVTVDSELVFADPRFCWTQTRPASHRVIEVKYPEDVEEEAAASVLRRLPWRPARHSKYVIGVERTRPR